MIAPELRIPLIVDAITIFSVVFGGGMMYQKISEMEGHVNQMQAAIRSIEATGIPPPSVIDRLARIEERQRVTNEQLKDLTQQIRLLNRQ